jgi:hypothetical protein
MAAKTSDVTALKTANQGLETNGPLVEAAADAVFCDVRDFFAIANERKQESELRCVEMQLVEHLQSFRKAFRLLRAIFRSASDMRGMYYVCRKNLFASKNHGRH